MNEMGFYVFAGFLAQVIDGALGMGYGVSASSLLLGGGIAPAAASATVHAAEVFTTGFSAVSHHYFGNIDRTLFRRLLVPGMIGAALGAYILVALPGDRLRPFVAVYLLVMGVVIVVKAIRPAAPAAVIKHVAPLGFVGALVDALGGGGWGPVVASTLLARGTGARTTLGTVNAVEFFVTLTASIVFVLTLGLSYWRIILGLAIGGAVAAPLSAFLIRRGPARPLMVLVGLLVVVLSTRTLLHALG
jgi:uncharacterized protein